MPAPHSVIGISSEWFKVLDCQPVLLFLCVVFSIYHFSLWNTALRQQLVLWVVLELQRFFCHSFIYLIYLLHTANAVALIHTAVATDPACISHSAAFRGKCDRSHLFMPWWYISARASSVSSFPALFYSCGIKSQVKKTKMKSMRHIFGGLLQHHCEGIVLQYAKYM